MPWKRLHDRRRSGDLDRVPPKSRSPVSAAIGSSAVAVQLLSRFSASSLLEPTSSQASLPGAARDRPLYGPAPCSHSPFSSDSGLRTPGTGSLA
jgi:hypothetical protein